MHLPRFFLFPGGLAAGGLRSERSHNPVADSTLNESPLREHRGFFRGRAALGFAQAAIFLKTGA
jgi:hypothetical protein